MEETISRILEQAVDGDVISFIQLILFLYLFRDRLSGHSLARDIGAITNSVNRIEKKIDRIPTSDSAMAEGVDRIEKKIDKIPTNDGAMAESVDRIEKKIDQRTIKEWQHREQ